MGGAICGPGRFTHLVLARCPWCCFPDETRVHAFREVHHGYVAPDLVCGECGQFWSPDMERLKGTREDEREANVALVRVMRRTIKVGPFPVPTRLNDAQVPDARG